MAMEHGARLKIKKVVFVFRLAEQGGGAPIGPENPNEWDRGQAHRDERGDGESSPTDVERCPGNGLVDGRDALGIALVHGRVGAPTGRSHLK